jgi:hypothetical protein
MSGMSRFRSVLVPLLVAGLGLAGCGSGAKQTLHYTTTPPTTISGVGVSTNGPPPKPNTPTACVSRWNGAANTSGRKAATQKAPKANTARIGTARRIGYFREDAGRCLVYLLTPPKSAVVFVETAPGRFAFTADATGHISPNADVRSNGRLQLRLQLR